MNTEDILGAKPLIKYNFKQGKILGYAIDFQDGAGITIIVEFYKKRKSRDPDFTLQIDSEDTSWIPFEPQEWDIETEMRDVSERIKAQIKE